jgi:hypothetical protein
MLRRSIYSSSMRLGSGAAGSGSWTKHFPGTITARHGTAKETQMDLRTLMQAGPAKANEMFARLLGTSDGAVKTRERLFAELQAELELHANLEEHHLFPLLRQNAETRDLVTDAVRDNMELRSKLDELDALPKNDQAFLERIKELQKAFRQHGLDEKQELLPAVQLALSAAQVQSVSERIEVGAITAKRAKDDEAETLPSNAPNESDENDRQSGQRATGEQAQDEAVERIAQVVAQPATPVQTDAPHIAASAETRAERVGAELRDAAVTYSDAIQTMGPDLPPVATLPDARIHPVTDVRSAWIGWIGQTALAGTQVSQDLLCQLADQQRRFALEAMEGWMLHSARVVHTSLLLAEAGLRSFASHVHDSSRLSNEGR